MFRQHKFNTYLRNGIHHSIKLFANSFEIPKISTIFALLKQVVHTCSGVSMPGAKINYYLGYARYYSVRG